MRKYLLLSLLFNIVGLTLQAQSNLATDSIAMSVELSDVVVTAQYAPTDSKNALQSIRTISRARIEQQGATNLEQLLQQDLNIRINQDLVLGSSMSILGVSGENVKIMVDGVPMVGRLNGNIDLSQINLNNIERIEIIEGPMSVSYGTDALGGVINLITKKSQRYAYELALTQQLETQAESSSSIEAGARLGENWLLRWSGGYDWFDGIGDDSLRSVVWNPKQQWYTDASLRYDFGENQRIIYQFSYFDEAVQNLGDIRRPQFKPYAFDDEFSTIRSNHALTHEGTVFKKFYWQNTLGYNHFDRSVNSFRLDMETGDQLPLQGDTTLFDTYMLRSVLASQLDSKINFQLGIDMRQELGDGARIVDPQATDDGQIDMGEYAVFGSVRYQPVDALTAEIGLRATQHTRYDAPLIPSFHLKYQLAEAWQVRASYGKGFRSPSLKELFLSFIDINHFIIGNPDLQAETSDNIQIHLNFDQQWNEHQLDAQLQLFHNRINNQIQLFPFLIEGDQIVPAINGQSNEFAYFNIAENRTQGANLRLNYQWKNLTLASGISTIGFFNPLSEEGFDVPNFTFTNALTGQFGYALPKQNAQANIFLRYTDRFVNYYPETIDNVTVARQSIQDGFAMLDASYTQSFFKNRLSLTGGIRNVLDITQVNVQGGQVGAHSGGSALPIGAGRSFFVRARLRLFGE
ncbi:MAG: TonB-dependent receptor [Bacteroidota bacterium]